MNCRWEIRSLGSTQITHLATSSMNCHLEDEPSLAGGLGEICMCMHVLVCVCVCVCLCTTVHNYTHKTRVQAGGARLDRGDGGDLCVSGHACVCVCALIMGEAKERVMCLRASKTKHKPPPVGISSLVQGIRFVNATLQTCIRLELKICTACIQNLQCT